MEVTPCPINTPAHVPSWAHPHWTCCAAPMWPFFGIGGVGGQAVEVLARSGVGELSLFDSDTVALSNLNRQLVALHSTLGQYKVDAMAPALRTLTLPSSCTPTACSTMPRPPRTST